MLYHLRVKPRTTKNINYVSVGDTLHRIIGVGDWDMVKLVVAGLGFVNPACCRGWKQKIIMVYNRVQRLRNDSKIVIFKWTDIQIYIE